VDVTERETYRPIPEILAELGVLEKKAKVANADLEIIFSKLAT
jgi:hypothetical protein